MAGYEVWTERLLEAGDGLLSAGRGLLRLREELDALRGEYPGLAKNAEAVNNAALFAAAAGRVLFEICEVYSRAERAAGNGIGAPVSAGGKRVINRPSNAVLFTSGLVIPDWLNEAVVKYEQSERTANEL